MNKFGFLEYELSFIYLFQVEACRLYSKYACRPADVSLIPFHVEKVCLQGCNLFEENNLSLFNDMFIMYSC